MGNIQRQTLTGVNETPQTILEACRKHNGKEHLVTLVVFNTNEAKTIYDNMKADKAFLIKADNHAFLSREGAIILYDHYKSEVVSGRMIHDISEMERLASRAKLPGSEMFVFTDN